MFSLPLRNDGWQFSDKGDSIVTALIPALNDVGQSKSSLAHLAPRQINIPQPFLVERGGNMAFLRLDQVFDGLFRLPAECGESRSEYIPTGLFRWLLLRFLLRLRLSSLPLFRLDRDDLFFHPEGIAEGPVLRFRYAGNITRFRG